MPRLNPTIFKPSTMNKSVSGSTKVPPTPDTGTDILDSSSIPHERGSGARTKTNEAIVAPKVDKRKFNGRKRGTKNLKTIAKESIVGDEFYKIARRKTGGMKDVLEMLFAKAVGEKDLVAAKIIMDKAMPNAQVEKDLVKGDLGITINISNMKAVKIDSDEDVIEGEVIAES